jgi:hypothetical protein
MTADERSEYRKMALYVADKLGPSPTEGLLRQLVTALDAAEAERAHDEQRVADLMADVQRIGAERDAVIEAARTWENEAERRSQRYIGMVHERDAAVARAEAERARVIEGCLAAITHMPVLCPDASLWVAVGYTDARLKATNAIRALAAKGE